MRAFEQERLPLDARHTALARQRLLEPAELALYVESGILLCHACGRSFPIVHGLPLLLPYTTPLHGEFANRFAASIQELPTRLPFASELPQPGEEFVLRSFSIEWLHYDYDGVIWELNYDEQRARLLSEMGLPGQPHDGDFLEVGCGLGITTEHAQLSYSCDAVGVDLSLASLRAARHFRTNPFLHFVQASVFHLPFPAASFQLVYSRGVLHHTYSTHRAFEAMVKCCQPGGRVYLWVYGLDSIRETPFRRLAYALEWMARPLVSRAPDSMPARVFLGCMGMAYMLFSRLHRMWSPEGQPLSFRRAIHAARDRFSPLFAHRHAPAEVARWFEQCGLQKVEQVDWHIMPAADQEDYRRNVGVRGIRGSEKAS